MKPLQLLYARTRRATGPRQLAGGQDGITGKGLSDAPVRWWRLSGCLALAASALALGGCDALTLSREPEVAHLELTSTDMNSITLVTSQWYIEVESPDCLTPGDINCPRVTQLVVADTSTINLPFQRSYPFNSRLQFYAEAYTTPAVDANVAMKVDLDDKEWYNDSRRLLAVDGEGLQETIKFQYQYHVLRIQ